MIRVQMKLPQLQNLIKRDPAAYQEEFEQQLRSYKAELQVCICIFIYIHICIYGI
jgi:hypothetical protein